MSHTVSTTLDLQITMRYKFSFQSIQSDRVIPHIKIKDSAKKRKCGNVTCLHIVYKPRLTFVETQKTTNGLFPMIYTHTAKE